MCSLSQKYKGISSLFGGFFIHLTLGSMFTWGVLVPYFTSHYRNTQGFSTLTSGPSFIVFPLIDILASFSMFFANRISKALTPKLTILFGGLFISCSLLICSLVTNPYLFLALYSIGVGIPYGILYIVPLENIYPYFPKHKGISFGFILCGIGIGTSIANIIAGELVNPNNSKAISINEFESYFDNSVAERFPLGIRGLGLMLFAVTVMAYLLTFNYEREIESNSGKMIFFN
jgi:MFS family permease